MTMRTPISYYGGKQSLLHYLLPMLPQHQVYTEVFFGGGSLYWVKPPARSETINDRLDIVVNFYRILKTRYRELYPLIQGSLIARTTHREALDIVKGKKNADDVTRAWAFWYVTNFSFANKIGGGYKYSNDQHTSVPAALAAKKREFTEYLAARLENTYIENEDAVKVLRSRNTPASFHYLDPPYLGGADQGHYKGYTEEHLEQLLHWCAAECTGAFLLSNYPSPVLLRYVEQNGWHLKQLQHSSKHGVHVKHRAKDEIIVWNYTEPQAFQTSLI